MMGKPTLDAECLRVGREGGRGAYSAVDGVEWAQLFRPGQQFHGCRI